MVFDNRHRIFLQALMQGGAVQDVEAEILCTRIFNQKVNILAIVASINQKLEPLAMSVKAGTCELTGEKYWSVVGMTHEEALVMPSEFTQSQRAFLRIIYSEIIAAEDGCISSTDCLNLSRTLDSHKLSIGDSEKFVKTLVAQKWLFTKDGFIYMGVRSIIELMPYFRATNQDNFRNCSLCREVVFHGHKCHSCDRPCHNACLIRYVKVKKQNKCPICKNDCDISNVPDEIYESQRRAAGKDSEDEDMDVSEEEEKLLPRKLRNSRKRSKSRKQ